MKRVVHLLSSFCLSLAFGAFALAGDASAPVIAILHTNDVHGRFAASDTAVGHDRVAAVFAQTRRRIAATLLLDAGDAIQGADLVKWNRGAAAVEIMNAAGYDAMALGNHEFDYGWENLAALARVAEFPFLTQPIVSEGVRGFEAAALFERGGRRVGVFGLTTPETKQASNGGFGKNFGAAEELFAYAAAMTAALRSAGAEVVVCLAHLGVEDQGFLTSYELRDRVDGIDLIVDGHSHTSLAEIVQARGKALIVSAGEHAEAIGLVEFRCENGRLVPAARSLFRAAIADVVPDPAVAAIIDRWTAETGIRGARVLATSPIFLDASRTAVRTGEAELGNLLADAVRAATGVDAALLNGGNIRAALPAGEVTVAALDAMLPYDTTILTASLSGGALREALELSVSRYPAEFGGFLQVSGLSFTFDPALTAGRRVTGASVGGRPLTDDAVYSVAVCDWLAAGGDGYEMLVEPFNKPPGDGAMALIDVFADYLKGLRNNKGSNYERKSVYFMG